MRESTASKTSMILTTRVGKWDIAVIYYLPAKASRRAGGRTRRDQNAPEKHAGGHHGGGNDYRCGAARPAAAVAPYAPAGDAVVTRRLVRILRSVLHRLYRHRPVQGRHLQADHAGLFDLQGFASFVAALFLGLFIGT